MTQARSVLAIGLGVARVLAVSAVLFAGCGALLLAASLPARFGGVARVLEVAGAVSRVFLWTTGVKLRVSGAEGLRNHQGFVFFNHLSFLDPVVLLAVRPSRFLAARGVGRIPFVGRMARAMGTIFVNRKVAGSRAVARRALQRAVAEAPVPVALAPEGRIGPGPGVLPLHRGAFEVATAAGAPVLLVALQYEPMEAVVWKPGEWIIHPLWRLCARTGRATVRIAPLGAALDPAVPAAALAAEAEARFGAALLPGGAKARAA